MVRPGSPSSKALLGDHSHNSTPILNQTAILMDRNHSSDGNAADVEYTEKELDDALAYLNKRDSRSSSSSSVPKWAQRLVDKLTTTATTGARDGPVATSRRRASSFALLAGQRVARGGPAVVVVSLASFVLALLLLVGVASTLSSGAATSSDDSFEPVKTPSIYDAQSFKEVGGVLDRVKQAPSKIKQFGQDVWESYGFGRQSGNMKEIEYAGVDLLDILNFDTPQTSIGAQLKSGVRYVTSMAYGGHANQFIAIQKLVYFAKLTNRVAIIPTLTTTHIDGNPASLDDFYDLRRLYDEAQIPAVTMSQMKPMDIEGAVPHNDQIACWSVQEATAGHGNGDVWSLDLHGIWVNHWPLPKQELARGLGGFDIAFDALRLFDFDVGRKQAWVDRVKNEMLPQKDPALPATATEEERLANVKDGFRPRSATVEPNDQLMCFDNTLFLGPVMFGNTLTESKKGALEPTVPGEGLSWINVGQYIRFNSLVERRAAAYLRDLFDIESINDYNEDDVRPAKTTDLDVELDEAESTTARQRERRSRHQPATIPPFISIHLRRGDFQFFAGFTPLERYTAAVDRVRARLQARLEDPHGWTGPGRKHFQSHGIPASKYQVVVTTDEAPNSEFVQQVKALGWKVLDHYHLNTKERFGGWWPTILDAAVLARGESFVGTDRSTFSHLAGVRVKYWRGGLVEVA